MNNKLLTCTVNFFFVILIPAQTNYSISEQMDTKPSTTTIVSSSDEKLKRYASITEPDSCELQSETQFEHGKQLTVTQKDDAEEKTTPIAIEMKDALQEVAKMTNINVCFINTI